MIWLHLFESHPDHVRVCAKCAGAPLDVRHFRNGGEVCDVIEGACACGAWHKDLDEHLERVKWQEKTGMRRPGETGIQ